MPSVIDLTGQRFGRLLVIKRHFCKSGKGSSWVCQCECGGTKIVRAAQLKQGYTKSCGCLSRDWPAQKWRTKHPLYNIWHQMKWRCLEPTAPNYSDYGGRGITLFAPWQTFENFISGIESEIGGRPSLKHSIHRIRNHGDYEPGNIKWATSKEHHAPGNTRARALGLIRGDSIVVDGTNLREACRRAGVSYSSVGGRIRRKGCSPREAIAHFEYLRTLGIKTPKWHKVNGLTLPQACLRAGVKPSAVHGRMHRRGETPVQAIEYLKSKK
jgi:hypothetical protein